MKKKHLPIAIGISALVLAFVSYEVLYQISQQQYDALNESLRAHGLSGTLEQYGSIEEAMGSVQFSYELKSLYDAYIVTMNEIYAVPMICIAVATICFSFSIALHHMQKR
ncbi:hypothetical protein GTO27_06585 [Candidatus Bathyarchaeota archaeon]|nr:hypothetical protein [Candidatus Bathyarchaeota archaeon]